MRIATIVLALLATATLAFAQESDVAAQVDAVMAKTIQRDAPGCAVGIARGGQTILERGYGMANLEYDIPIAPSTIFEAGSVSKQFTAAAVLLLVGDGKLSLDDPVRKYVPELPASDDAITIRHLLSHTSGLRDWGTVVGLAGWRRGTRAITHAHVLDVIAHQRALNFAPGTQWTYSNSGYNLAAMIVERVSGKAFPDFTRERIFAPLGMTHSSWRDDYTRVVKGRATAYDPDGHGSYVSDMDVENIYGNCCLLTTVGDLLRWNENFRTKTVGGAAMVDAMQTPAKLSSGATLDYGFGLFLDPAKHEVYHSGATAGYRAFLTRKLDDDLSIALLCNRGDVGLGSIVERIANVFVKQPSPVTSPAEQTDAQLARAGLYRDPLTDAILPLFAKQRTLHLGLRDNGPELVPLDGNRYRIGRNVEVRFDADGIVHLTGPHKPEAVYRRVAAATPSAAQLAEYAGSYTSDEAGVTYEVAVEGDHLVSKIAPARTTRLDPTYVDGFVTRGGDLLRFTRDKNGRVDGVDVKADVSMAEGSARVERLHFVKR